MLFDNGNNLVLLLESNKFIDLRIVIVEEDGRNACNIVLLGKFWQFINIHLEQGYIFLISNFFKHLNRVKKIIFVVVQV